MSLSATASVLLGPLPLPTGRLVVRLQPGRVAAPVRPTAYQPWLYLTPPHLALQQSPHEPLHFFLEDEAAGQTVAQLSVFETEDGQAARSPWQAPFGAVQASDYLSEAALMAFLEVVHRHLIQRGIRQLTLRPHAFAYHPHFSARLTQVLTRLGYEVRLAELNMHLPLAQSYMAGLHPSERRRLKKCERHGLRFEQEPPLLLPLAYDFLRRCREEKGQTLSMPLERLQELFRQFPRQHFLYSVRDAQGQWAALTVVIQVSDDVLYNFYPASPLAYNTLSPMVLLNAGLHAFGQASGMRLLDLGTSTLPTGLNHSLLQFKRHLGGVPSLKLTFTKTL
ncbi:GNAT family N-acetyltransferase [Hymenobacter sp. DG01]|uniref:GNAT family N-acetyltransferase n=1 Tax=Hymenobacter sp. DG01 TaxID=2584940 RepID=UPI00111F0BB4|nr:GNAT family N-acetyltransferase [Hymenobacter sp. DG01]